MPFEVLSELSERFSTISQTIREQLKTNPSMVTPQELKEFDELRVALENANYVTSKLLEQNQPLTTADAKSLRSFYQDYITKAKAYAEKSPLYIPADVLDIVDVMKNTVVIIEGHADALGDLTKRGAKPATMKDILSDYRWVAKIFRDDPQREKNKVEPENKWNYSEHSFQENLDEYRKHAEQLPHGYIRHLQTLTGDKTNWETSYRNKLGLLQQALKAAYHPEKCPINVMSLLKTSQWIQQVFDPSQMKSLHNNEVISKSLFDTVLGPQFDLTLLSGDIENSKLSKDTITHFETAFKQLSVKPENLGVSAEALQSMDDVSTVIRVLDSIQARIIANNGNVDPVASKDRSDPLFMLLNKTHQLNAGILSYLKDGDPSKLPTEDAFGSVMDYFNDYAVHQPLFKQDNTINQNVIFSLAACETIKNIFPALEGRYAIAKNNYDAYLEKEIKRPYLNLAKNPVTSDAFDSAWAQIRALDRNRLTNDEAYERASFMRICRDDLYREDLLKTQNSRAILLSSIINYEFSCASAFAQTNRDLKNKITKLYNRTVTKAFLSDEAMTDDDIQNLEKYYDTILERPQMQELLQKSPDALKAYLEQADMKTMLYGSEPMLPASFSGDTLNALTQSSGNFYASNSDQYNNIGKAMAAVSAEAQSLTGISTETLKRLYDACNTYMATHNSQPTSTNGKLRFNAAATVMAEIGTQLMEKLPEQKAEIERDFKIHMIRSKHFRDECVKNSPEKWKARADQISDVLQVTLRSSLVKGKLSTPDLADALLTKYGQLERTYEQKVAREAQKAIQKGNHPFIK